MLIIQTPFGVSNLWIMDNMIYLLSKKTKGQAGSYTYLESTIQQNSITQNIKSELLLFFIYLCS